MRFLKSLALTILLIAVLSFGFLFSSFNSVVVSDPFAIDTSVSKGGTSTSVAITPAVTPEPTPEPTPVITPEPTPVMFTLTLVPYGSEGESITAQEGELVVLPECEAPEDMINIGWVDSDGKVYRYEICITADITLEQICVPCFTDTGHEAYLSLNNGIFNISGSISRAEFDAFLSEHAASIDTEETEVSDADAENAEAEEEYDPEANLTYLEAWTALSVYLPVPEGLDRYPVPADDLAYAIAWADAYGFMPEVADKSTVPGSSVTRLDYVIMIDFVLGRRGDSEQKLDYVGNILDINEDDPDYWLIAEAVIPHKCEGSGINEVWTESVPSTSKEFVSGINVANGRVYFVKDDGTLAVNEEINGSFYGSDGTYTSGNEELDDLIAETFIACEISKKETTREKLSAAFYYIVYHNTYRKGELYEDGNRDWVYDEAIKMLATHKGNCYSFASAFWACAKALGYDATVYTGLLNSSSPPSPHGWVEIRLDGQMWLCDPELCYQEWKYNQEFVDFFMKDSFVYQRWGYERYEGQE